VDDSQTLDGSFLRNYGLQDDDALSPRYFCKSRIDREDLMNESRLLRDRAYANTPRGFVREQGRWWWRRRLRCRIFEQCLAADQIAKNGTAAFSYYRQRQVPRWARLVDYDPNP